MAAAEAYLAIITQRRVLELNERARDNARAHFDFHFYTGERSRIEAIRAGRCGELADCGDMKRAW